MSGSSAASLCPVFNELLAVRGADAQTKARWPCLAKARLGAPSHGSDHSQGLLMDTELPLRAGCSRKRLMSPDTGNTLISEWGLGRCSVNWESI